MYAPSDFPYNKPESINFGAIVELNGIAYMAIRLTSVSNYGTVFYTGYRSGTTITWYRYTGTAL